MSSQRSKKIEKVETHQLLVYADVQLDASREVGLGVNTKKTKHVLVSPEKCTTKSQLTNG
jgi:hypothetical protein